MNIFKRAMTAIRRSPVKTLVLFALVLLLGTVTSAAVSIYNAVTVTEESIYNRSATVATVDFDYDRIRDERKQNLYGADFADTIFDHIEYHPTAEQLDAIGSLPQVEYYDYFWNRYVDSVYEKASGRKLEPVAGDPDNPTSLHSLKGTSVAEPIDFKSGILEIVDGRLFDEAELRGDKTAVVLSKKLADANGLTVGSIIELETEVWENLDEGYKVLTTYTNDAEIIGLFDIAVKNLNEYYYGNASNDDQTYNKIFSTNGYFEKAKEQYINLLRELSPEQYALAVEYDWTQYESYFILSSPKDVERFKAEAAPYLPDYNKITATTDFSAPLTAPLETMKSFAVTALIVSIAAVIVILGLVIMLFLRSRRGEMGIYLALGERRGKIMGQVIVEVLTVAILAMLAAVFIGNIVSGQISDKLVVEQVTAAADAQRDGEYYNTGDNLTSNLTIMGYNKLISGEFIAENYDVSMNARTVLIFFAVGITAVVLAVSVSMIYIVTLNPKKILMEV